ncbi:MAG TPA: MG2 domain-containing protein, partial [Vicinamibacteria bacterium]|nr:MG2 domain-containing protein [Vicinamibacteria bacterium]
RVRAYAVTPADWPEYQAYQQDQWNNLRGGRQAPPGRSVLDTTVAVRGPLDELAETRIDLAAALGGDGRGHLAVTVTPAAAASQDEDVRNQRVMAWVQATAIGLSAFVDESELLAWTSSLADGRPLEGVELQLLPGGGSATSDAEGLARIALPDATVAALVARRGDDTALLPATTGWWSPHMGWRKRVPGDQLRWLVFDTRGLYRPGEDVHVKGWVRSVDLGEKGDVEPWAGVARGITYTLYDARRNEIAKGTAAVNAHGGFDLQVKLPPTMNLGHAAVELRAQEPPEPDRQDWQYTHAFQVQEFRRPEYEVTASSSQAPHFVGESATVTVSAQYFAGGALAGAPVTWQVASATTTYRPPNREDFAFGRWLPWWDVRVGETPGGERTRT